MQKCPYRRVINHEANKDIEEFAHCYRTECPYYDWVHSECKKVKAEIERKEMK